MSKMKYFLSCSLSNFFYYIGVNNENENKQKKYKNNKKVET